MPEASTPTAPTMQPTLGLTGLTVAEYLVLHPGYKLTGTEKRKYEPMVLRAAARMIEEARR